jgi:hypothetical protein
VSVALSPQVVRRLAFIRFLHTEGLEHARRAQPLASTALPMFHDAVEMFLLLAAEHLGVTLPKHVDFEGYFNEITKATGLQLPARNAMRRMNNSRVNFKHHGSIPSATDLEQFRADVTTFLTDATQMIFQADFARLDMIDLVTQQSALEKLRDAEAHAGQGDYTEALALLSEAFDGLLDDYAGRKLAANGSSPYTWLPRGFPAYRSTAVITIRSWSGGQIRPSPRWRTCSGPCVCSRWAWTTGATPALGCLCPTSPGLSTGTGTSGLFPVSRSGTMITSSAGSS